MAATNQLTEKQAVFVREYLIDLCATAAYKRAGYKVRSDASAAVNASRLLRNAKVAAAIAEAQAARSQRTEVDQDWVIKRLKAEAEEHGEHSSHGARVKALELLGRHIGMWKDAGGPTVSVQVVIGVDEGRLLGTSRQPPV